MPVSLDGEPLTPGKAGEWLGGEHKIPEHLRGEPLATFLNGRSGGYSGARPEKFLSHLRGFHEARANIDAGLGNVTRYEQHLQTQCVTDELARRVLGVREGKTVPPESMVHVKNVVERVLTGEQQYIDECRESLEAQRAWHASGPVDKGDITEEMRQQVREQVARDKGSAKYRVYEPVRNKLMSMGFVVTPPGTALGAVFPERDWLMGAQAVAVGAHHSAARLGDDDGVSTKCREGVKGFYTDHQLCHRIKPQTDELLERYALLGDDTSALTRALAPPKLAEGATESKANKDVRNALEQIVGCLCVSWTLHRKPAGEPVYVPILGVSSIVQEEPNARYFEKYCRHLALPSLESDKPFVTVQSNKYEVSGALVEEENKLKEERKGLNRLLPGMKAALKKKPEERTDAEKRLVAYDTGMKALAADKTKEKNDFEAREAKRVADAELEANYETMIRRTNGVILEHRVRTELGLRRPSRQAILSYVSFRKDKTHPIENLEDAHKGVDLSLAGWHSLNCAEPAALLSASSHFCAGNDVLVCFPCEGKNPAGTNRNRPKETCPWCASVELGYRSISHNPGKLDNSLASGDWKTRFTLPFESEPAALPPSAEFDARDPNNPIMRATRDMLGVTATTPDGNEAKDLVKNKDLATPAYTENIETKIGRIKSMYYLLGLLDPEIVATDRAMYSHAARGAPRT